MFATYPCPYSRRLNRLYSLSCHARAFRCKFSQTQRPTRLSRHNNHTQRAYRSCIVATSEFWWEDEQEFDAVKETLHPKTVYLVTAPTAIDAQQVAAARAALEDVKLQTAFAPNEVLDSAEAIWEGRSKPPHFFKLRVRNSINTDITAFLLELLGQNWKVELDYGLGNGLKEDESLLVVATQQGLQGLLQAVGLTEEATREAGRHAIACLQTAGVELLEDDDTRQELSSLIGLLKPQLRHVAVEQTVT